MAKKSTSARHAAPNQRSATSAKPAPSVQFVRTPNLTAATQPGAAEQPDAAPALTPVPRPNKPTPVATLPKPASRPASATKPESPKPAAAATAARPAQPRDQATRIARARATQRARAANLVTPEHYSYVLHDLRLTGALAACMALVLGVLHFVLG